MPLVTGANLNRDEYVSQNSQKQTKLGYKCSENVSQTKQIVLALLKVGLMRLNGFVLHMGLKHTDIEYAHGESANNELDSFT